jgi:hypothetical protein
LGNIEGISAELLVYDVLQKRKAMIDAFAEGLDVLLVASASRAFPTVFWPLFVASGPCSSQDVLDILHFKELEGGARQIANYLRRSIQKLKESGKYLILLGGGWVASAVMYFV